jgi:hypothetical protein
MKTIYAPLLIAGLLVAAPASGLAQSQTSAATASTETSAPLLKAEELDQLVAPIALYPDTLLASVLMASTYPLEVIEASRWVKEHKNLKGEALKAAVDKEAWDESVKELTATASVLDMMSTKLDWTQKLGDAVLAQQADVMDAVQRLRTRAEAQNKLQTTKEQKVTTQTQNNKKVIVIEPAAPDTIYVPYYDPAIVYGPWPYSGYPPYYFPPAPGYYAGAAIATGIAFGVGVAVGAWAAGGHYWGGGVHWGDNNINVNRQINVNNINANNNWRHDPAHRQGVRYNNRDVANRFGKGNELRDSAKNRMDFRGHDGRQVLNPDRNAGNRLGQGGAGQQRAGDRGNIGKGGAARARDAGNRGRHDTAFSNANQRGRQAFAQSQRGHASLGGRAHPQPHSFGGGGRRGGGGFHGGGMRGGGGFHGGGRRR